MLLVNVAMGILGMLERQDEWLTKATEVTDGSGIVDDGGSACQAGYGACCYIYGNVHCWCSC